MADRILTRQETILLHLLQYIDVLVSGYVMPYAMTQQGIGLAAGMSRAHVSNCMVVMREKGLVDSVFTHLMGEPTDRLFSLYSIGDRGIYIITEWDRSATTILFPEKY